VRRQSGAAVFYPGNIESGAFYPGKMVAMEQSFIAFLGGSVIASGLLDRMLAGVKLRFDEDPGASILIFEDATGRRVDFDLRGSFAEVVARTAPQTPRSGPGCPRLGVVARGYRYCRVIGSGWNSNRTGRQRRFEDSSTRPESAIRKRSGDDSRSRRRTA
jgi:hypothetical protein